MNIEEIEKSINYNFKNKELLKTALTHISYANENDVDSYEKLEFLGDSILEFISSKYLYNTYKNLSEGAAQELKHTRMNQIKRFLGIKPDMSREENIIRQSQESERLAAELLSRFSETIKNSKSKPISFN